MQAPTDFYHLDGPQALIICDDMHTGSHYDAGSFQLILPLGSPFGRPWLLCQGRQSQRVGRAHSSSAHLSSCVRTVPTTRNHVLRVFGRPWTGNSPLICKATQRPCRGIRMFEELKHPDGTSREEQLAFDVGFPGLTLLERAGSKETRRSVSWMIISIQLMQMMKRV